MTTNRDLTATWTYHDSTKHSLQSVRSNRHFLDWENQPFPFKLYTTLEPLPLLQTLPPVAMATLDALVLMPPEAQTTVIPNLSTLAALLFLSAGITKRRSQPGRDIYFRAAACTGALYHIDLYLICGELPDLPAGVYHFGPHDFALRRLRAGDYRSTVAHASGQEPAVTHAPVTLVCTSTYWRNAWKYQARTYRHCFWDAGTLLANLLAATTALRVPTRVVGGFVDLTLNHLLDLDTDHEVALALVPLGYAPEQGVTPSPSLPLLNLPTAPLSKSEIDYPAIRAMHAASSLTTEDEVPAWREKTPTRKEPAPSGRLFPLLQLGSTALPTVSLDQTIRQRGSTRTFAHAPISFVQLSTLLLRAISNIPADFLDPLGATLTDLYLIVNAVEDLPAGSYVFHRSRNAVELLREGDFRREAGYLGLGQELPADASVNIFCLTNLSSTLECFGNRGYRAAQIEAGIIGGKLYLAAYGQGLGATGLTFFDDDVTTFFSPHAAGKSVMFLTALGPPVRKRKGEKV